MNELAGASVALASLIGLACWARTVPTRAWGDGASTCPSHCAPHRVPLRAWAVTLATFALQVLAATATSGLAARVALVIASWMVLGWLLVLAMNQWPVASRLWAPRLGALGCASCVLVLSWQFLGAWAVGS